MSGPPPREKATPTKGNASLAEINGLKSEFAWAAAVHDRLRTADLSTVEALLDEADTLEPGGRRYRLKEFAYARDTWILIRARRSGASSPTAINTRSPRSS